MPHNGAPRDDATDKSSPDFWRAIKTGDFVSLSDAEAFAASLAGGDTAPGGDLDYAVGDIRSFELRGPEGAGARPGGRAPRRERGSGDRASLGSYRFIELQKDGSGPLYLALVDLPERFELRLYFIPSGLESGTRDGFIDRGDTWLFLPPPDPEDFVSSALEYAPYPDVPEIEEAGVRRKLIFSRVGAGSLYGESSDTHAPVIITEYSAEASDGRTEAPEGVSAEGIRLGSPAGGDTGGIAANPLLLVLEEGWMRSDGSLPEEGGYLTVLLGKVMRPGDLDYYPA
jgi:hypothetical protein